jgi:hypothetical protein
MMSPQFPDSSSERKEVAAVTEEKRKNSLGREREKWKEKSVKICYFNKYTRLQ